MDSTHRNLLRSKRMVLCKGINSQAIIESLTAANILTKDDIEILKIKISDLKKNEKLLDILPKRGPKAFDAFVEALRLRGQAYLLGEGYKEQNRDGDAGKRSSDNAGNAKMNEEKPAKKDEKCTKSLGNHDEVPCDTTDVPYDTCGPLKEEFYDIVDVPVGHQPDAAPKNNIDIKDALDIYTDPVGKLAKVEEPFMYDTVDTPLPKSSVNGYTESNTQTRPELMINTDSTDFPGQDATDAPPSAATPEHEDGPFSRLGSQKTKDAPAPPRDNVDIVESASFFTNHYSMKSMPRGHFLLINNKDFLPASTMEPYPRNGTDIDANAMHSLFEELGFIVHSYRNATCQEMKSAVKKIAHMDHSKSSAVACCFLSHGKEGILYGTDGEVEIRDLTQTFSYQKSLAGKPKMFFFQACQGSEYMDGVEPDAGRMEVDGPGDYGDDVSVPTEADFIYAYSTVAGFYSWRNSARGSWFIQGFVEMCRKYAHKMDLLRILTRVNEKVASSKSATGQRFSHNKRQIPSIITQLRRELYLFPAHGPLKEYKR